jgi:RNA polymerase sigma-70 factor, ECF subfamily
MLPFSRKGCWGVGRRGRASLAPAVLPSLHNAPDRSETYHRIWQISGVKDKPASYKNAPSVRAPAGEISIVMPSPTEITGLLVDWSNGDQAALEQLLPLVERELHRLAHSYMRKENPDHTLQTSALVNEAYLKLVDQKRTRWQNRAHFFGIAAQIMRRILTNYARDQNRAKRGGKTVQVSLSEVAVMSQEKSRELLALDEALNKLAEVDERKSQVVELRYFGGLSVEETAEVLKISAVTVMRDWKYAQAWLARSIRDDV